MAKTSTDTPNTPNGKPAPSPAPRRSALDALPAAGELRVERLRPATDSRGRPCFIGYAGLVDDTPGFEEAIADAWGGGVYSVTSTLGGEPRQVRVAGEPRPIADVREPLPAQADGPYWPPSGWDDGAEEADALRSALGEAEARAKSFEKRYRRLEADLRESRERERENREREQFSRIDRELADLRRELEARAADQVKLAEVSAKVSALQDALARGGGNDLEARIEMIRAEARLEEQRAQQRHDARMAETQRDPMEQLVKLQKLTGNGGPQMQFKQQLELFELFDGLRGGRDDDDSWRGLLREILPDVKAYARHKIEEREREKETEPHPPQTAQRQALPQSQAQQTPEQARTEAMLKHLVKISREVNRALRSEPRRHPGKAAVEILGYARGLGDEVAALMFEMRGDSSEKVRTELAQVLGMVPSIYPGRDELQALHDALGDPANRSWMDKFIAELGK